MKVLATAAQMRELDRTAIEDFSIPSLDLMEEAARATVQEVLGRVSHGFGVAAPVFSCAGAEPEAQNEDLLSAIAEKNREQTLRIAIFCGPGNNGGDGVAAARLLMEAGCRVRAFLVGDRAKMTPDERAMEEKLNAVGGVLEDYLPGDREQDSFLYTCDGVVDAIFGVGLCRPVTGIFREAIEAMNRSGLPVIACDVPSGVNADTGEIMGCAVKAAATVTFTCPKPGLYLGEGGPLAGEVKCAQIGIPSALVREQISDKSDAVRVVSGTHFNLPRRKATAHKGDFGRVFILAGCEGYTGAPVLTSRAAVRSGAGLVFLGVPREIYPIIAVKCDEAMPYPLPEDYSAILQKAKGCDVALIGPGLGRAPQVEELVLKLIRDLTIPVVLDADGINALSAHMDVLDKREALTVLTPHDGEFQRLTGCELPILDRISAARDFARNHHCVMILKGHATVTAVPEGRCWVNHSGNPGMARGGSGDVLAGMLAALLGQKQLSGDVGEVCAMGVHFHGLAGDRCAEQLGEYGMTPTDMLGEIPLVFRDHTR